jgi:hypothetical protein
MADPGRLIVSETRARQGRRGLHVFWVLAFSTVLAGLAVVAAWAWGWSDLAKVRGSVMAPAGAARTFDREAPAARQTSPQP